MLAVELGSTHNDGINSSVNQCSLFEELKGRVEYCVRYSTKWESCDTFLCD